MFDVAFLALVAFSVGLVTFSWWSQRSLLRSKGPETPASLPPVSILKPLKGRDPSLEDNLASFLELDGQLLVQLYSHIRTDALN